MGKIAEFFFLDEKHIRSFMKRLNKIGPNIDPCGTSLRISRYKLKVDSILKTFCKVISN